MDYQPPSAREILERLVAIASLSSREAAAADELTSILETGGLMVHRMMTGLFALGNPGNPSHLE